jgi:hypothetical protein
MMPVRLYNKRWSLARHLLPAAFLLATMTQGISMAVAAPADDLVAALHYDQYYTGVANVAVTLAEQKLKEKGLTGPALTTASATLQKEADGYKNVFLSRLATVFSTKFTPAELQQLTTFYKSPLGVKVAGVQTDMQDQLTTATRDMGIYIGVVAAQLTK